MKTMRSVFANLPEMLLEIVLPRVRVRGARRRIRDPYAIVLNPDTHAPTGQVPPPVPRPRCPAAAFEVPFAIALGL